MNLEQIDTSTTAGKAEVMRLAAEGRRVAYSVKGAPAWMECPGEQLSWNWVAVDYAIIAEPVGPEEVWVVEFNGSLYANEKREASLRFAADVGATPVLYIRSDLPMEKGE